MLFAILLLVAALIAVGLVTTASTPPINEGPRLGSSTEPSQKALSGPPVNWDEPMSGTTVGSNSEASGHLSFNPVVPANIAAPIRIIVDSASSTKSGQQVAYVFQDPVYGRFVLTEGITRYTQASLDALADCTASTGCEGTWTQFPLSNGRRGLLITGGPTTGIIWLDKGVTFDVFGPVATFSIAAAQTIADEL